MSDEELTAIVRKYVSKREDRWGHERIYLRIPFMGGIDQIPLSGTKMREGMEEDLIIRLVKFLKLVDTERKQS